LNYQVKMFCIFLTLPLIFKVVLLASNDQETEAFKWAVNEVYMDRKFSFSERYMYGSDTGPLGIKGDSKISIDLDVFVESPFMPELNLTVLFYTANEPSDDELQYNFCSGLHLMPNTDQDDPNNTPNAKPHGLPHLFQPIQDLKLKISNPQLFSFQLQPEPNGERHLTLQHSRGLDQSPPLNPWDIDSSRLIKYVGRAEATYKVQTTGVQYAVFTTCPAKIIPPFTAIKGSINFRNPYGYLPGMYFGFLPWNGIRALLFVIFDMIYFYLFCRYRDKLLKVHIAIGMVLVMASLEAFSWFAAYVLMDVNGTPSCCPFPVSVIVSLVLENLRKTMSRTLLLMICLGWGVVRPMIEKSECAMVALLTVAYMAAGYAYDVTQIIAASHLKEGGISTQSAAWAIPYLLCDILFLSWIYVSIIKTMQDLKLKNQNFKLQMYEKLGTVVTVFVTLFTLLTLAFLVSQMMQLYFPWQLLWVETVSWDVMNFAVLVTVCLVWRPSERSQLLAAAQQLPTNEEDADDDMEGEIEMEDAIEMRFKPPVESAVRGSRPGNEATDSQPTVNPLSSSENKDDIYD